MQEMILRNLTLVEAEFRRMSIDEISEKNLLGELINDVEMFFEKAQNYTWLKLKHDFVQTNEVKRLRKTAKGRSAFCRLVDVMTLATNKLGFITIGRLDKDIYDFLATKLNEKISMIKKEIKMLVDFGFVILNKDEKCMFIPDVVKNTGNETKKAEYMREYRSKNIKEVNTNDKTNKNQEIQVVDSIDLQTNDELLCNQNKEKESEKNSNKKIINKDKDLNIKSINTNNKLENHDSEDNPFTDKAIYGDNTIQISETANGLKERIEFILTQSGIDGITNMKSTITNVINKTNGDFNKFKKVLAKFIGSSKNKHIGALMKALDDSKLSLSNKKQEVLNKAKAYSNHQNNVFPTIEKELYSKLNNPNDVDYIDGLLKYNALSDKMKEYVKSDSTIKAHIISVLAKNHGVSEYEFKNYVDNVEKQA